MVAPGLVPALLFALTVVGLLALSRLPVRPRTLSGLAHVTIAARRDEVYDVLTDLARFPSWFGSVTAAAVVPSEGEGGGVPPTDAAAPSDGADGNGGATAPSTGGGGGGAAAAAAAAAAAPPPAGYRLTAGSRFRLTIAEGGGAPETHTAKVTLAAPPSRLSLRSYGNDVDGSNKVVYVFNLAQRPAPAAGGGGGDAGDAAGDAAAAAVETTVHCAFDVEVPCSAAVGVLLPLVRGLARRQLRGYLTKLQALVEEGGAGASAAGGEGEEARPAGVRNEAVAADEVDAITAASAGATEAPAPATAADDTGAAAEAAAEPGGEKHD